MLLLIETISFPRRSLHTRDPRVRRLSYTYKNDRLTFGLHWVGRGSCRLPWWDASSWTILRCFHILKRSSFHRSTQCQHCPAHHRMMRHDDGCRLRGRYEKWNAIGWSDDTLHCHETDWRKYNQTARDQHVGFVQLSEGGVLAMDCYVCEMEEIARAEM